MRILKFGGSSLADDECIRKAAAIIAQNSRKGPVCVVLSAVKGTTNALVSCALQAEAGDPAYKNNFARIKQTHLNIAGRLFKGQGRLRALTLIEPLLQDLKDILHGVELIQECSLRSMDLIMSFGERLSCHVVSQFLSSIGAKAQMVDAREIIKTNDDYGAAGLLPVTNALIESRFQNLDIIPVVTGFIASAEDNVTTTLGRNGSDYTASIIGAALKAAAIEIWTDVDGIFSTDPRIVPDAFVIPALSFKEAAELSFFGAEVIHPYTMIPAIEADIPIIIKNTFNPAAPGTLIEKDVNKHSTFITGIASIDDVAIINVEGGGMIGIHGIAVRILGAIANAKVNIIMISQASSEHSICLVIKQSEYEKAAAALRKELYHELGLKRISDFEIMRNLVVISIIGENMRGIPGISGRLFSCLGAEKINVLSIAQGSSERNLSFVIDKADKDRALKVIHTAFLHGTNNGT